MAALKNSTRRGSSLPARAVPTSTISSIRLLMYFFTSGSSSLRTSKCVMCSLCTTSCTFSIDVPGVALSASTRKCLLRRSIWDTTWT